MRRLLWCLVASGTGCAAQMVGDVEPRGVDDTTALTGAVGGTVDVALGVLELPAGSESDVAGAVRAQLGAHVRVVSSFDELMTLASGGDPKEGDPIVTTSGARMDGVTPPGGADGQPPAMPPSMDGISPPGGADGQPPPTPPSSDGTSPPGGADGEPPPSSSGTIPPSGDDGTGTGDPGSSDGADPDAGDGYQGDDEQGDEYYGSYKLLPAVLVLAFVGGAAAASTTAIVIGIGGAVVGGLGAYLIIETIRGRLRVSTPPDYVPSGLESALNELWTQLVAAYRAAGRTPSRVVPRPALLPNACVAHAERLCRESSYAPGRKEINVRYHDSSACGAAEPSQLSSLFGTSGSPITDCVEAMNKENLTRYLRGDSSMSCYHIQRMAERAARCTIGRDIAMACFESTDESHQRARDAANQLRADCIGLGQQYRCQVDGAAFTPAGQAGYFCY